MSNFLITNGTYIQVYTKITSMRHPELVSGSRIPEMLKRVQHDGLGLFRCKLVYKSLTNVLENNYKIC